MQSIKCIRIGLESGEFDGKLTDLYCRSGDELAPYRERMMRLMDGFKSEFSCDDEKPVVICSAPGRTEIGGNHTDHQRGKVLTGSVDLDALACAAKNENGTVRIYSEGYGMNELDISDLHPKEEEKNTTKGLIRGMIAAATEKGYEVGGFDAYVISDVPGGSGLSSSACFEVLLGELINDLFCNREIPSEEIAKMGKYAENVYFGKPSGLLDQMGCAMGGIVAIDFKNESAPEIHRVDFDFSNTGYALCIIDTGADHSGLTDEYAAVTEEMKSVARALGKEVLGEVEAEEFYARVPQIRKTVGDRALMRAIHYFTDNQRVDEMVKALENDDFESFLKLVSSSGHSSFMFLQNVDTYKNPMQQPVALAIAMAGYCLKNRGARRVHGGGFAGTIQAYVPIDSLDEFKIGMDSVFGEESCRITYIRPVGGTAVTV